MVQLGDHVGIGGVALVTCPRSHLNPSSALRPLVLSLLLSEHPQSPRTCSVSLSSSPPSSSVTSSFLSSSSVSSSFLSSASTSGCSGDFFVEQSCNPSGGVHENIIKVLLQICERGFEGDFVSLDFFFYMFKDNPGLSSCLRLHSELVKMDLCRCLQSSHHHHSRETFGSRFFGF
jgi:hypothetical protein